MPKRCRRRCRGFLSNGALPSGDKGVKVENVDKGSTAAQIGLQKAT